jgi:hypothetical protein
VRLEAVGIEPAYVCTEVVFIKGVRDSDPSLAADRQRKVCANCHLLALNGIDGYEESGSSFMQIKTALPQLPPHIYEAISTLVHVALATENNWELTD